MIFLILNVYKNQRKKNIRVTMSSKRDSKMSDSFSYSSYMSENSSVIANQNYNSSPQNQKQNECAEVMQARHAARFFIFEQIERTGRRKALYDSFKSVDGDICAGNDLDVSFQSYIACAL